MPRNASGVYTLPAGNPVVPNTTIATAWANPTLSDIAQALTDSLDRNGLGGMLVSFRIADGTISAPGLAFTNELGLGIWRSGSGAMQHVSGGVNMLSVTATVVISPVKLEHRGYDTYKLTGQVSWRVMDVAGNLTFTPSATINNEDWDTAKTFTFNKNGTLALPGGGSVTYTSINVTGNTTTGTLNVTGRAVVGDLYSYSDITALTFNPIVFTGSGTNISLNFQQGASQLWTLTGAANIQVINHIVGAPFRVLLRNTNNAITWESHIKWPNGVTPNLGSGPLKVAVVDFFYDGTNTMANGIVY